MLHLAPLLGPLLPRWDISKTSRAVLKAFRTHLKPSGRPFGALLGRLGRNQEVPRGDSEAPKLSGNAPFCLCVSLFGFVRCFRHLWVPYCAVFFIGAPLEELAQAAPEAEKPPGSPGEKAEPA